MKIPRDITGRKLCKLLGKYGYGVANQTGSHIKMTTQINGEHHITVPAHNPLKVGTLNNILYDVAQHLNVSKDELIQNIF